MAGTDRLRLIQGDEEIFLSIKVLLAPGHSPALQVVSVNTAKGTAIIGSDSATIARSYKEDWPSCITIDLLASLKSYDKSLDAIQ